MQENLDLLMQIFIPPASDTSAWRAIAASDQGFQYSLLPVYVIVLVADRASLKEAKSRDDEILMW